MAVVRFELASHGFKDRDNKPLYYTAMFVFAGVAGFEPTPVVLETNMLPLTPYSYLTFILILLNYPLAWSGEGLEPSLKVLCGKRDSNSQPSEWKSDMQSSYTFPAFIRIKSPKNYFHICQ